MDTLADTTPAPPQTPLLGDLQLAFQAGVLSKDEFESKKAALEAGGTLALRTDSDVRMRAGQEIASFDKPWRTLESFDSYTLALSAVKSDKFGRFKWATSTGKPGDRRFVCNEHVKCARPIRIFAGKDGQHHVQIYDHIAHTTTPQLYRRKNSSMTADIEDRIKKSSRQGAARITAYQGRACMYQHVSHISLMRRTACSRSYRAYLTRIAVLMCNIELFRCLRDRLPGR